MYDSYSAAFYHASHGDCDLVFGAFNAYVERVQCRATPTPGESWGSITVGCPIYMSPANATTTSSYWCTTMAMMLVDQHDDNHQSHFDVRPQDCWLLWITSYTTSAQWNCPNSLCKSLPWPSLAEPTRLKSTLLRLTLPCSTALLYLCSNSTHSKRGLSTVLPSFSCRYLARPAWK